MTAAIAAGPRGPRGGADPGASEWEPAGLGRRLRRCLEEAGRAVAAALDPQEQLPAEGPAPLVAAKVIAEAAMLLRASAPLGGADPALGVACGRLLALVADAVRREDLLVALVLEPQTAPESATASILLSRLGRPWPAAERMLGEILAAGPAGGPERLPNHDMEREWLLDILLDRPGGATDALLPRTCLAAPLDGLEARRQDLHIFTHVLLYATDMGRRPLAGPRPPSAIAADAELALAFALDEDNLDLAAEALWAWPMLGLPWTPAATFAFRLLTQAQERHGFVPGPGHRAGDDRLRTSYHASLVTGILVAATLATGCVPPPRLPAGDAPAAATDAILALLPPRAPEPAWRADLARLDAASRGSLAGFALTVLLRRARAARDVGLLRDALALAVARDLDETPVVGQAAGLLRRATLLGSAIG